MATDTSTRMFDPQRYKNTTREQWQDAAEAWHRWTPTIQAWLGPTTTAMFDLAGVGPGARVLDIAAGAGEPTISAARRVTPAGSVLAIDISANILEFAAESAREQGLTIVKTKVMDGEHLTLPDASFDAAISRVGLIYFPDQQRALAETRRVLRPNGRFAAMVYTTPERNGFFSIPIGIIRRRAQLPPPLPGQPGPFSLGGDGVLADAFRRAGFHDVETRVMSAPLRLPTADDCIRFERESFGALHQMMTGLSPVERAETWAEIEDALRQFESPDGFVAPCEMIVAAGVN